VADVTDEVALRGAATSAARDRGPIEILVNCAGSVESAPFVRSSPDLFRRMLDVHLLGAVHAAQALLPGMLERRSGRIVNVASTASLQGYRSISAYCAAKHALLGLTRALALEVARKGVTVNAVCPGYTETAMLRDSLESTAARTGRSADEQLALLLEGKPLGRLVRPEEVAAAVLWLCGPGAAAVNGQAIAIDGGETAG
jgi:NAD(P)-dependent dehydrogenase (short-subunit alcohol dehydrogenase family)